MKDSNQLLKGIDYYIHLHEQKREGLLSFNNSTLGNKKQGLDYRDIREKAFGKLPEKINGILLDEFIEDVADWRRAKTFYSLERAEEVIEGFKKLEFDIPEYLGKSFNEVKKRTEFVDRLTQEGMQWNEFSKNEFVKDLQKQIIEFSFNEETEKERLRECFYNRVEQLKAIDQTILEKYGFYIDYLFEEDQFTGDSYNLNLYFYEGEKKQQTVEVFGSLQKLLIKYFQLKKELIFIQDLVRSDGQELPSQIKARAEELKDNLAKYGFFNLPLIEDLSMEGKKNLVKIISNNGIPYSIAMFDYLGFLKLLNKEYFTSKYKLYREISKWFDSDKEGRSIKGNISSLLPNTTENKDRYTAFKHIETVKKDYQQLK